MCVDKTARQLLKVIASRHADEKTMTVTNAMAMAMNLIASAATIHRKLDDLCETGLIEQSFGINNRRTMYLTPTKAADKYFSSFGQMMKQSTIAAS